MTPRKARLAPIEIFEFTDYRQFIGAVVAHCLNAVGMSTRAIARACDIKSPGYLTEVIAGRRSMTPPTAVKLAAGFGLDETESAYLAAMIELAGAKTPRAMDAVLDRMRRLIGKARQVDVSDPGIHDSWLHAALLELAKRRGYEADAVKIRAALRVNTRQEDVEASLRFLEASKLPKNARFVPINDIRRIDIQKKHLFFLQMAQHRLNDPIDDREFQGLTIAIDQKNFVVLKERLRAFIASVNEELASDRNADEVIRVQLAAFKLTR